MGTSYFSSNIYTCANMQNAHSYINICMSTENLFGLWCLFGLCSLHCIFYVNLIMTASLWTSSCWSIWFAFLFLPHHVSLLQGFWMKSVLTIIDHMFCRYFSFKGGLYLDRTWDRYFLPYFLLLLPLLFFVYSLPES